jgi:alkylhydroperoxidase domain protein/CMD domain protein
VTETSTSDVLGALAGIAPGSPLAAVRGERPAATAHAQGAHEALFSPPDAGHVSGLERAAIALRVAAWHGEERLISHYRGLLAAAAEGGQELADVVVGRGPGADDAGVSGLVGAGLGAGLAGRLAAELRHADLLATRPVDARPDHLAALEDAGLAVRDVVTVSQLAGFVGFQSRVLSGLLLLADAPSTRSSPPDGPRVRGAVARSRFIQDELGWTPWLAPLSSEEATPEQEAALRGPRARSPYFRLLAWDAPILVERTATDEGIFRTEGGLPRGERELAAAAASRVNGCVYCASVHARFASTYSRRREDVQRLLDEGVEGEQDERWRALIDFAAVLTVTPPRLERADLARLRELGLGDLEVLDLVQATAFFAWANRLMLTLGEPVGAQPAD